MPIAYSFNPSAAFLLSQPRATTMQRPACLVRQVA